MKAIETIMDEKSEISVVIPTYKRSDMLLRLLKSISLSTIPVKEIIVIDGYPGSTNEELLRYNFHSIKYIKLDHDAYVGELRNIGLKISTGKFVFMVDDDNTIKGDCIEILYKAMVNDDLIGVTGPVSCYYEQKNIIMYAGGNYSTIMRRTIFLKAGEECSSIMNDKYEVDGFANSYMFRRDVALKVYPIPNRILFGGEDGYIQYRIKQELGFKLVLIGNAIVYHDIKKNEFLSRMTPFKMYYLIRGKITFELDLDQYKYRFFIFLPLYLIGYIYMALNSAKKKEGVIAVLHGLIDGLFRNYLDRF